MPAGSQPQLRRHREDIVKGGGDGHRPVPSLAVSPLPQQAAGAGSASTAGFQPRRRSLSAMAVGRRQSSAGAARLLPQEGRGGASAANEDADNDAGGEADGPAHADLSSSLGLKKLTEQDFESKDLQHNHPAMQRPMSAAERSASVIAQREAAFLAKKMRPKRTIAVVFGRTVDSRSVGSKRFAVPSDSILSRQRLAGIDRPLFRAATGERLSPSRSTSPVDRRDGTAAPSNTSTVPPSRRPASALSCYPTRATPQVVVTDDETADAAMSCGLPVRRFPSRAGRREDVYDEPIREGMAPITHEHRDNRFVTYHGQYTSNVKNGQGKLTMRDGGSYVGDFADGEMHGEGTRTWPDGAFYKGQFVRGEMHGKGLMHRGTETFEGAFHLGQRHGFGTLRTPSVTYEGDFERHKYHGHGVLKEEARLVSGHFRDGKLDGTARVRYANGDTFVGDFVAGNEHGQGTFFAVATGVTYTGGMVHGARAAIATTFVIRELRQLRDVKPSAVARAARRLGESMAFAAAASTGPSPMNALVSTPRTRVADFGAMSVLGAADSVALLGGSATAAPATTVALSASLPLQFLQQATPAGHDDADDDHPPGGGGGGGPWSDGDHDDHDDGDGSSVSSGGGDGASTINNDDTMTRAGITTVAPSLRPAATTASGRHTNNNKTLASTNLAPAPVVAADGNYSVALAWGRPFPVHPQQRVELAVTCANTHQSVQTPARWPVGSSVIGPGSASTASRRATAGGSASPSSAARSLRQSQRGAASSVGGVTLSTVRYGLFAAGDPVRVESGRLVTFELYAIHPKRKDCLGVIAEQLSRAGQSTPHAGSILWHPAEPKGPNPSSESLAALATRQVLLQHEPGQIASATMTSQLLLRTVGAAGATAQLQAKKKGSGSGSPPGPPPATTPTSSSSAAKSQAAAAEAAGLAGPALLVAADPVVVAAAGTAVRAAILADQPPPLALLAAGGARGLGASMIGKASMSRASSPRHTIVAAAAAVAPPLPEQHLAGAEAIAAAIERKGAGTHAASALSDALAAAWYESQSGKHSHLHAPHHNHHHHPHRRGSARRRSSTLLPMSGVLQHHHAPQPGLRAPAVPHHHHIHHGGGGTDALDVVSPESSGTHQHHQLLRDDPLTVMGGPALDPSSVLGASAVPTPPYAGSTSGDASEAIPTATEIAVATSKDGEARFRVWLSPFAPQGTEYLGVIRYADESVAVRPHGGVVKHATAPVIFPVYVGKR